MDYLIRFSQSYETFRLPEIQALADLEGIDMKVISYSNDVRPLSLTTFQSHPLTRLIVPLLHNPPPHPLNGNSSQARQARHSSTNHLRALGPRRHDARTARLHKVHFPPPLVAVQDHVLQVLARLLPRLPLQRGSSRADQGVCLPPFRRRRQSQGPRDRVLHLRGLAAECRA